MTGLQVWLHPSSRTKSAAAQTTRRDEACLVSAAKTRHAASLRLHSAPFRRPAPIMRNGRRVLNGPHFDSRGGQRAHCRLSPRSRTPLPHIHSAHPGIARHAGGVRRSLLRRKRRPFAGPAKTERTGTLPRQHIAAHVGDGHDGVIERGLYVHPSMRDVLALFLLKRLLFAFFFGRRRGAACCCRFCHFWSSQFSVLSSQ